MTYVQTFLISCKSGNISAVKVKFLSEACFKEVIISPFHILDDLSAISDLTLYLSRSDSHRTVTSEIEQEE
jgi:hypothetical protein